MRRARWLLALACAPLSVSAQTASTQQPAGAVQTASTTPVVVTPATAAPITEVVLPNGTKVTRACEARRMEGIEIQTLDNRPIGSSGLAYLQRLRLSVARRLWLGALAHPRKAVYGALLLSDGSVTQVTPVGRSDDENFNISTASAINVLSTDPFAEAIPLAMPDSLPILVSFGYHTDGSEFLETHTSCSAAGYPDNAPPAYPKEMLDFRRDGWAVARFVVDTAGRVDSASIKMLDWSDDAMQGSIFTALRGWHFVPAEIDKAKMPEILEVRISVSPPNPQ